MTLDADQLDRIRGIASKVMIALGSEEAAHGIPAPAFDRFQQRKMFVFWLLAGAREIVAEVLAERERKESETMFEVHRLNDEGLRKAEAMQRGFTMLLAQLEELTGVQPDTRGEGAREMALARTNLETACFYAKRAMALQAAHQLGSAP